MATIDTITLVFAWVVLFVLGRWLLGFLFPHGGAAAGQGGVGGLQQQQQQGAAMLAARRARDVITGAGGPQRALTPLMMERVNQVAIMFPHISRAAIENDMRRTNSAQATIDNILEGRLQQQRAADETPAGIPAPQSPSSYLTLLKKVNQSNEHIAEPPKVWSADSEQRQSLLAQRKQFMLQQARDKFLASEAKQKQQSAGEASSSSPASSPPAATLGSSASASATASTETSPTLSASPPTAERTVSQDSLEQRRAKALEAAQKRSAFTYATE